MKLKALIVDDEENSRELLQSMLTDYISFVEVVGMASNVQDATNLVNLRNPDIIFLDIEMPQENGFKLLENFPNPSFDTIFITAYDEFAIKAFRLSATDYLLKPINPEELQNAVEKVSTKVNLVQKNKKLQVLLDNVQIGINKISLPTSDGYVFVKIDEIIRCEADGNYSIFYTEKDKIVVSKTLKTFEEMLGSQTFFRVNRSNIVNLNKVKSFSKHKSPSIILDDNTVITVSEIRRKELLAKLTRS